MLFSTIAVALASAGAALAQGAKLTANTPTGLVQCEPSALTWVGGTAPYFVTILPGNQPSAAPLVSFPTTSDTTLTWNVNLAPQDITLQVKDSTGTIAYSAASTIRAGSTTTCSNASGVSTGTAAAAGASSAAAGSSAAPAGSTTVGTTKAPAASSAAGASSGSSTTTSAAPAGSSSKAPSSGAAQVGASLLTVAAAALVAIVA